MKPLVIYHANCADGFGAAFAAWTGLGDEAEYVPMQYGKEDESFWRLEDGQFDSEFQILNREIYILDFSFSKWVMEGLFSLAKCVVWLDHHASAFKEHGFTPNAPGEPAVEPLTHHHVVLDNNKSGAMLAWEYFHPGTEVPMLIQHIDDRDRWQFKLSGTKEFHAGLWSRPFSFDAWARIYFEPDYEDMAIQYTISEGNIILRAHDQNVQSVVKGSARECWIKAPEPIDLPGSFLDEVTQGWQGLAANCPPHLTSDVGHELANQSGTFGLCWTLGQSGTVAKCSLRSNGEYDVSAIARTFGGGGHRNAAGFEVDIQTLLGWLK